jgi:hypothetical protein
MYNDSSKHVRLVNISNDNARTMDTYLPKFNTILNYGMKFMLLDLIGSWIILQCPSKSPKLSAMPDMKQPLQVLALTMIDPSTMLLNLIVVSDKESLPVTCAFNCSWLCHYPRPLICPHEKGTKFTGIEF